MYSYNAFGQTTFIIGQNEITGILIEYEATYVPLNECGEYRVKVDFSFPNGGSQIQDDLIVKWKFTYNENYYFQNTSRGNPTTIHLSDVKKYDITMLVTIDEPNIGLHSFTDSGSISNPSDCTGCRVHYNYCDFWGYKFYDTNLDIVPQINEFRYYNIENPNSNGTYEIVNTNNNFGIFTFPYYIYNPDGCSIEPNLYDFVDDMNRFLDLVQSNSSTYEDFHGHMSLLIKEPPNGNTLPDYCKIYLKFEDMGGFIDYFQVDENEIEWCKLSYLGTAMPSGFIIATTDFTYDISCLKGGIIPFGNIEPGNIKIHNNESNPGLYCYPNISSDIINIEISNLNLENSVAIKIFDINGKYIEEINYSDEIISLDISNYKCGIYFLQYRDEISGKEYIAKFIKQ